MKVYFLAGTLALFTVTARADDFGGATGKGTIDKVNFGEGDQITTETVPFAPKYAVAFKEQGREKLYTWVVLTEKTPPAKEWAKAADKAEAQRSWCETAKASFIAAKLDNEMKVDLFYLCPGNGIVNMEMVSTINGLDSVAVTLASKTDQLLKGTLIGGSGACTTGDKTEYCTKKSDYAFVAPVIAAK